MFVFPHFNPIEPETPAASPVPFYVGVLHELIEIGASLARRVQGEMEAEAATVAFERVSRSVRRSIMLADKLAQPAPAAVEPGRAREGARRQIIRRVEDAIQRNATPGAADTLHAELLERLDGPELEDDIGQRPVDEIIDEICSDLGINGMPGLHLWQRRRPGDVALLHARAAAAPVLPGAALERPGGVARWAADARIRGP